MAADLNVVRGNLECCDTLVLVIYCGGQPRSRIDGCGHATLEKDPEDLVIFYALRVLIIPQMVIPGPFTHIWRELGEDELRRGFLGNMGYQKE